MFIVLNYYTKYNTILIMSTPSDSYSRHMSSLKHQSRMYGQAPKTTIEQQMALHAYSNRNNGE